MVRKSKTRAVGDSRTIERCPRTPHLVQCTFSRLSTATETLIECLRKYSPKNVLAFRTKVNCLPPSCWCACARGKQNPAGDASEIKRETGMCAIIIYEYTAAAVQYYTIRVLVERTRLEPLVPGQAYLVPGTVRVSTQQTTNQR